MQQYVDLEFGLHRRDAATYAVALRFSRPDSDSETRLVATLPADAFGAESLQQLRKFDLDEYGNELTKSLFADKELKAAFAQACAVADSLGAMLRLRIFIGRSAPELHGLCWEALRNPVDGAPLFTGERILLSRYLNSTDWRTVPRRPKTALRGLIVIASPLQPEPSRSKWPELKPLDVPAELARAKAGLDGIACAELASGGTATLEGLFRQLRDGCDILYLVCHGALIDRKPWLWLEDEAGRSQKVAGSELIQRMGELRRTPSVVVLASCQSAGGGEDAHTSDAGILAALGPGLAEAGVPAVIAMQGDATIATMARFMPVFFHELQRDGQIDRAIAVARGSVRDRHDWYVPVLFMRLRDGCLWYKTGFEETTQISNWQAVLRQIQGHRWTPILGPGLTDSLLGSRREIAQRWAETFHFPMASYDREDLPQVAQFLAVNQKASTFPQNELVGYLHADLLNRYSNELSEKIRQCKANELPADHLNNLISAIGARHRKKNPEDPFAVLARLPVPIYVTAVQNDLIADALRDAGKQPRIDFCRWNEDLVRDFPPEDSYPRPDVERPLVYHLFGQLRYPESMVISEDDYLRFLIGAEKNKELIPHEVGRAFTDTGLLFLGFQLDDWNFRVLFRAIMDRQGGRTRRSKYAHIAAQIDLEEGRILEPKGARAYLESYFHQPDQAPISIYWGSPEEFVRDLLKHWEKGSQ